jgi:glutamate decarboxylase
MSRTCRHIPKSAQVAPVLGTTLRGKESLTKFDVAAVREHGWIVPAYVLPPDLQDRRLLRVVVKENFSRDRADKLLADLANAHDRLAQRAAARSRKVVVTPPAGPIC